MSLAEQVLIPSMRHLPLPQPGCFYFTTDLVRYLAYPLILPCLLPCDSLENFIFHFLSFLIRFPAFSLVRTPLIFTKVTVTLFLLEFRSQEITSHFFVRRVPPSVRHSGGVLQNTELPSLFTPDLGYYTGKFKACYVFFILFG